MMVWIERQSSSWVSKSRSRVNSSSLMRPRRVESSAAARSYSSIMAPTPPFRSVRVMPAPYAAPSSASRNGVALEQRDRDAREDERRAGVGLRRGRLPPHQGADDDRDHGYDECAHADAGDVPLGH